MFELCLFDLDETLIKTEDLKEVREACKRNQNPAHLQKVVDGLKSKKDRCIYSLEILNLIRSTYPKLKIGVFTRSPNSYAKTVLDWAYPGFNWDILVAYEDVRHTKPYGEGIKKAMTAFNIEYLDRVMLVGDNDADVRAAYNCGCLVTLDKGAWPYKWGQEHWRALDYIPDAVISAPEQIIEVLANPVAFLPALERAFAGDESKENTTRFDKVNYFVAKTAGGDNTAYPIFVCGRSFANYDSISERKKWHELTESIEKNKDSDEFPVEWVETVRVFIRKNYMAFFRPVNIVISVVPHRPGRKPRLENFLTQLKKSFEEVPMLNYNVSIAPKLLEYKVGVKSQHNDHLGRDDRFINVRDHLVVKMPELIVAGTYFLVIDDVTTTGASLIYASKYLKAAGAIDVKCLSMAKNIGNLYT